MVAFSYIKFSAVIKKAEMVNVMILTSVLSTEEHVPTVARISMADSLAAVKMAHSKLETGKSNKITQ